MINAQFFDFALNSFTLAALAAILAVMVAVLLAYGSRVHRSRTMAAAARVASMGYAVPGSVIAVGVLLVSTHLDNGFDAWMRSVFGISTGLLLTGTIAAVVFAYLVRFLAVSFNTVEASFAKVTPSMDGAARTLGLGPLQTLRRVHAPLISGSTLTAAMLVFVDVMKELPATIIMRPFNFDTLAIRTYQLVSDERLTDAASAALAIVAVGIVPVIILTSPSRVRGPAMAESEQQTEMGLVVEGVSHAFDGRAVVRDINLQVAPSELVCLLGPSGCGKTTILRIVAGLEELQSGRIVIDGRSVAGDVAHVPPEQRRISLLFQDFALFPHLTVMENVVFGARPLAAQGP